MQAVAERKRRQKHLADSARRHHAVGDVRQWPVFLQQHLGIAAQGRAAEVDLGSIIGQFGTMKQAFLAGLRDRSLQ